MRKKFIAHRLIFFLLIGTIINPSSAYSIDNEYRVINGKAYFLDSELAEADAASFAILEYGYAKDKNHLYRDGQIIGGVDAGTVQILNYAYFKDAKAVYWYIYGEIEGADLVTFDILRNYDSDIDYENEANLQDYAVDKNYVYNDGKKLSGFDPATFKYHGAAYTSDKNGVYCLGGPAIPGADPSTFEVFYNELFAKDKGAVYFGTDKLPDADPATFQAIGESEYFKDKSHIYFVNKLIPQADYETFRVIDGIYARDKSLLYKEGEATGNADGAAAGSGSSPADGPVLDVKNTAYYGRLKGKIILKVEDAGRAYYVHPAKGYVYYLGRPEDAFRIMREQGTGIKNNDLYKIPVGTVKNGNDADQDGLNDDLERTLGLDLQSADTDKDGYRDGDELSAGYSPWGQGNQKIDVDFTARQRGKILIQVEKAGEAWYVNPADDRRYFLGRPADAFQAMRSLGLGISNKDFNELATVARQADSVTKEVSLQGDLKRYSWVKSSANYYFASCHDADENSLVFIPEDQRTNYLVVSVQADTAAFIGKKVIIRGKEKIEKKVFSANVDDGLQHPVETDVWGNEVNTSTVTCYSIVDAEILFP